MKKIIQKRRRKKSKTTVKKIMCVLELTRSHFKCDISHGLTEVTKGESLGPKDLFVILKTRNRSQHAQTKSKHNRTSPLCYKHRNFLLMHLKTNPSNPLRKLLWQWEICTPPLVVTLNYPLSNAHGFSWVWAQITSMPTGLTISPITKVWQKP